MHQRLEHPNAAPGAVLALGLEERGRGRRGLVHRGEGGGGCQGPGGVEGVLQVLAQELFGDRPWESLPQQTRGKESAGPSPHPPFSPPGGCVPAWEAGKVPGPPPGHPSFASLHWFRSPCGLLSPGRPWRAGLPAKSSVNTSPRTGLGGWGKGASPSLGLGFRGRPRSDLVPQESCGTIFFWGLPPGTSCDARDGG